MSNTKEQEEQEETIIISKERYKRLIEDQKFLKALRAAGVDNWEGYDIAAQMAEE